MLHFICSFKWRAIMQEVRDCCSCILHGVALVRDLRSICDHRPTRIISRLAVCGVMMRQWWGVVTRPPVPRLRDCFFLMFCLICHCSWVLHSHLLLHCSDCCNNLANCSLLFYQLMNSILNSHALGPCLLDKTEIRAESRNLLTEIVANYMLLNIERLVILWL